MRGSTRFYEQDSQANPANYKGGTAWSPTRQTRCVHRINEQYQYRLLTSVRTLVGGVGTATNKKKVKKKNVKKQKKMENIPFSSLGQPAPPALLAALVPPGTVFRQHETGLEFAIKKVRKWGKYDTPLPMTKHWLNLVDKIYVEHGVPVVDCDEYRYSPSFYASARTADEEAEHRRKMEQQTVEAAQKHLVGRYFWESPGDATSKRILRADMWAGAAAYAWYDAGYVPRVKIIFLYPSSVPKLVSNGISLASHARRTGRRDGVATWIRDYTRENAIAICMKRLQLPPEITQLILQYFWAV
jgi:hypothetical protein